MPAGMLCFQKAIGSPTMVTAIPDSFACAATASPNGPAPIMRSSVVFMRLFGNDPVELECPPSLKRFRREAFTYPIPGAHHIVWLDE